MRPDSDLTGDRREEESSGPRHNCGKHTLGYGTDISIHTPDRVTAEEHSVGKQYENN